jgi:hypothetical protein
VTLQNILHHPIYAGAYVYGRRSVDARRKRAGHPDSGRVVVRQEEWEVLLKDRLPAYISWDQYEANLARLQANRVRADTLGVVRDGPALLTRLAICGRCGCRMAVTYKGDEHHYAYACARRRIEYGEELCQHVAGAGLDAFVSQQVLLALEPAALELSLEASTYLEQERADLERLWQQKLERATYEADRAGRQYRLVEPENRLVARQLERDWEEKLTARLQVEEERRRCRETQPRVLTVAEREAIRQLAANIPTLWHASTTTMGERKDMVRQVVERVVVAVQGESERVRVTIDWIGGSRTEAETVRPVARLEQLSYYPQLCERVRQLAAEGLPAGAIAERLNAEGYRPPKRHEHFGPQGVLDLLQSLGLCTKRSRRQQPPAMAEHEWGLRDLAQAIGMPHVTLYNWLHRGWVQARREEQPPHRWILWADEAERDRLRQRHQRSLGEEAHQTWCADRSLAPTTDTN